ncbi:caspase family protein [Paraburkholderia caballeronis]|uniref:caspase family protein n=1 Tax=Paraburkholderia caballeronis TaxID=416943 RepID=UPI0010CF627A|nr:caspase family protein [Paraburkholderia caballeronis]TDV11434.1 putative caspase-like protein [Paraburkholderia caballeronis]TDV14624.1 putative caspase-like protein [Paraburkholderia caballeronis]TDV23695.1 putative caspase-like protein [Paraburkholderia caballeronis]
MKWIAGFVQALLAGVALLLVPIGNNAQAAAAVAASGGKVALVIGNSGYGGADRLLSPANDAKLIGDTLKQLGFDTRVDYDLSQDEFNASVDWLAGRARGARVVVFYYAGHGFESGGDNFLVPVKTGFAINAMTRLDLLEHAVRLNTVRTRVKAAGPAAFVALIDACRVPSRGPGGATLKHETVARGELIAFSTADQASAYDSMRTFGTAVDDGPFAYYLAMYLKAPDATIKGALEQTQQQVSDQTLGRQRPWIASGLLGDVTMAQAYASPLPAPVAAAPRSGPTRGAATAPAAADDWRAAPKIGATPLPQTADTAADQRSDSWDDAEYRLTMASQHADREDIAALRARGDDPAALTTLGMIYEGGFGVRKDSRTAVAYYRRAAQKNYPIAQTLLGEVYFEGKLVPRDYHEAERWLARAAAQDHTRAKLDLAQLRAERGQGDATQNWANAISLMMKSVSRQSQRPPPPAD